MGHTTDHAYTVAPSGRAKAPVVVLHAWWGLTDVVRGVCDDLAGSGYTAVAPDLYHGAVASTPEQARRLRGLPRKTPMWREIVAAMEAGRSLGGAGAVGQIGFSMGGHWALWLAKQSRPEIPPIAATVAFYAVRAGDFAVSRSAFQFHLAGVDGFVSPGAVTRQRRALEAAGREAEFHAYPGTGHWFFEWDRPDAYQPAAAELAWARTIDFLDRHLPA